MTVKELKAEIEKYTEDFKVVIDVSRDYKDYDEVTATRKCAYSGFRGGDIWYDREPNAVFLK